MLDYCWKHGETQSKDLARVARLLLMVKPKREITHRSVKSPLHLLLVRVFMPRWLTVYKGNGTISFRGFSPRRGAVSHRGMLVQYPQPLNWILIVIWRQWRFVQERLDWGGVVSLCLFFPSSLLGLLSASWLFMLCFFPFPHYWISCREKEEEGV